MELGSTLGRRLKGRILKDEMPTRPNYRKAENCMFKTSLTIIKAWLRRFESLFVNSVNSFKFSAIWYSIYRLFHRIVLFRKKKTNPFKIDWLEKPNNYRLNNKPKTVSCIRRLQLLFGNSVFSKFDSTLWLIGLL